MWTSFSGKAESLVEAVKRQVIARGHGEVDTGHFLLAALEDSTSAAGRILTGMKLRLDELERQVEALLVVREGDAALVMRPLNADAKRAVELAYAEARRQEIDSVRTDHLLLGAAGVTSGVAARALACQGVDVESLRETANRLRSADPMEWLRAEE